MLRRVVYAGRIVNLGIETARLPDGRILELEIVRHRGAAAVVPITEDGRVVLIRQYRHAAGGVIWEVPAGVLEEGESPERCAERELAEETGHVADSLDPLGEILTTPGFTDERIWLFAARGARPGGGQHLDADEHIRVVAVDADEALAMARDGRIRDAKTICALHLALCPAPSTP